MKIVGLVASILFLTFVAMGLGYMAGIRYSECRTHGFSKFYCFTGAK